MKRAAFAALLTVAAFAAPAAVLTYTGTPTDCNGAGLPFDPFAVVGCPGTLAVSLALRADGTLDAVDYGWTTPFGSKSRTINRDDVPPGWVERIEPIAGGGFVLTARDPQALVREAEDWGLTFRWVDDAHWSAVFGLQPYEVFADGGAVRMGADQDWHVAGTLARVVSLPGTLVLLTPIFILLARLREER